MVAYTLHQSMMVILPSTLLLSSTSVATKPIRDCRSKKSSNVMGRPTLKVSSFQNTSSRNCLTNCPSKAHESAPTSLAKVYARTENNAVSCVATAMNTSIHSEVSDSNFGREGNSATKPCSDDSYFIHRTNSALAVTGVFSEISVHRSQVGGVSAAVINCGDAVFSSSISYVWSDR